MATVEQIRELALSLLGSPYVLGNEPWFNMGGEPSSHPTATDCSGLVFGVFRKAGVPWRNGNPWPRCTADDYAKVCARIKRHDVRCGDVALFAGKSGHVYHIALCIDHDHTVEARGRRWGVVSYKIDDPVNGVLKRGAYFARFPWIYLEEEDMTPEQDKLLKQLRLSSVADSYDRKILIELLKELIREFDKPLPPTVTQLERQRDQAVADEKRRLGL